MFVAKQINWTEHEWAVLEMFNLIPEKHLHLFNK